MLSFIELQDKNVIIPCAGKGARLEGYDNAKCLINIKPNSSAGETILQHALYSLTSFGFDKESVGLLHRKLSYLGFDFVITKLGNLYLYKRNQVENLFNMIGEIPQCFIYKKGVV